MASYSSSTTLVRPNKRKSTDKKEKPAPPTRQQVWEMHQAMKTWYEPRDILIRRFIRMHELQSPFGMDKAGMQDGGIITATGDVEFDIATFPFDIVSLAVASMDNLHPQAYCTPRGDQSEDDAYKFEKLMNAALDMRMQRSNFNKPLIQKMAATGWAVLFHPFDPELNAEGEFPFDIQVMNPLGVYPNLNTRGEPTWVTYERRMTGAQLYDAYGHFPGIAELFEDEPDKSSMSKNARKYYEWGQNSIENNSFTIIRFYNDTYTCLLLDCSGVTNSTVLRNNSTLKRYNDAAKDGHMQSVMVGSDYDDDYAGVLEHHLGRVPFSFDGVWNELRDNQTGIDGDDDNSGRFYWLPFLYSQYSNWRNISRILAMFHSTLIKTANRPYITDSDVTDLNRAVIKVSPGESLLPIEVPQMPGEALKLLDSLMEEVDRASYAPASYGAKAGTSGAQQDQNYQAGSIRMDTLKAVSERVTAKALKAIGYAIIEQGDETFSVYGNGEKYDGPYTINYNAKGLKYPPAVTCKLVANSPFANPENVLMFKTMQGLVPDKRLYGELLKLPNPQKVIDELREEQVMKNDQNLAPYVQLGALKAQNELFKSTTKEAWTLQKNQDEAQLWVKKEQALLDQSQVQEENEVTQIQAGINQATLPPPPPPGMGGSPSGMNSSPSMGGGPTMNGQPPGGLGTAGLPSLSGISQGPGQGLPPNLSMPGTSLPNGGPQMPPMPLPQPSPPMIPAAAMMGAGQGQPPDRGGVPLPSVAGAIQRAPDDRGQPLQKLGRDAGQGITNPGVNSRLLGANSLPGQLSPELQAVNRALTQPSLNSQLRGTQRSRRKPRRARSR